MRSVGMQTLGSSLALLGWLGVILSCGLPMWKVTAFIGTNIVTAQIIWEGIWMNCVMQSTGQTQCKMYDSTLVLSPDLQAARALMIIAIILGITGLLLAFIGGKCTNFVAEGLTKAKLTSAAGFILISTGILCLVPVSWTGSTIISDFYNPLFTDAQRREIGASLYIGWGATVLLILGGILLLNLCPPKEEKSPSVKYLIVRSSRAPSKVSSVRTGAPSTRPSTPAKTYI
ncbi:claudin-4-like [Scleropages formosus]|uniref:claudin-4-like n=1 Tax=Scleropages formosus TaxID=113540 RepID=UPI0008787D73|nr:claudin-4-like [Scleropages formosus]